MRRGDALFPAKLTRAQQGDGRLFPRPGYHAEPDAAALDVKHAVSMVTLRKGQIFVAKMHDYPAQAAGGQKRCRVEVALFL
jgi:hypothetical protein